MQPDSYIASYTKPREARDDHSYTLAPEAREALKGAAMNSFIAKHGDCMTVTPSNASRYLGLVPDLNVIERGTMRPRKTAMVMFPAGPVLVSSGEDLEALLPLVRAASAMLGHTTFPAHYADLSVGDIIPMDALVEIETAPVEVTEQEQQQEVQDHSVQAICSRLAELSGLDDGQLARLFKVHRETVQRWRTGVLDNPRQATRRRMALLLNVLEDLKGQAANPHDWLLNTTTEATGATATPYDLLERGRIDVVTWLIASMSEPVELPSGPARDPEPLQFGDDDLWEFEDTDDDG